MDDASTITMIAGLSGNVNIQIVYELIPVMHPRNPDGSRFIHPVNTRNKIPFFGIEDAVVCAKYKGQIRGIRQNKGQMNNVVSIDLQKGNKNVNIKLAKSKVQLTGANSEKMGKESFISMCSHVNNIQKILDYIRGLPEEVRQSTINWVIEQSIHQKNIYTDFTFDSSENKLYLIPIQPEVISKLSESSVDKIFASFLWSFSGDFDNVMDYSEKFRRVIEICYNPTMNAADKTIELLDCNISNSVYNYNLGKEVSLIELTKHLNRKGFSVSFHNWNSTQLKVSIPIFEESKSEQGLEDEMDIKTSSETSNASGKIKAHRFTIHRKLSIKQTSPTCSEQAIEARNILIDGISDFDGLYDE
jgi:hypothetical protein